MYSNETIEYAKAQEQKIKVLEYRDYNLLDDREGRSEVMRDYARVLYSSSFRRLQGKMQLLGVDANRFNRNRLTHSLEVAQIARAIASNLGLETTIVVETASLAHDIGNPPFGHYGEMILNELCSENGGYEGNAQAFRILRTLEKKHHSYNGLNLTLRTMFAITKYFFNRSQNQDKFLYDEDYDFLQSHLHENDVTIKKSIDAEIMDLADEIAYAAHDLEDALSFNMLSIGEIVHEFKISKEFGSEYQKIAGMVQRIQSEAMNSNILESSEEYLMVLKKELTSTIVNVLVSDISIVNGCLGYKNHSLLSKGLKKLLFRAVLRKKDVQLYEKRGEKIIRGLFEVYSDKTYNKNNILLPAELRSLTSSRERIVTDYISGMMDSFAAQEYKKYFGGNSLDKIYPSSLSINSSGCLQYR